MRPAYPPPRVPATPVLAFGSLLGARRPRTSSVMDIAHRAQVTSGRIALALALREMGIGAGHQVMLPAWHSASMVPPVLACGATPVFYRIGLDAAADLADIDARCTAATRVLVAVNYYGFRQPLAALRAWCDRRGVLLLEDCAHCFFGCGAGPAPGSWGDYAIASSMKFYPVYEGGCLVSARHPLRAVALRSAGLGFELKAALAACERGAAYGRLGVLRPLLALRSMLWRQRTRKPAAAASGLTPSSSDSSYDFDPSWLDKRASLFARVLIRAAPARAIADARRRNYLALDAALGSLPGWRALFPTLPDNVVPWAWPVVVERADEVFDALKNAGIPLIRFGETLWEGVDASVCAVSADYSRRVFGVPCHQELTGSELDWLIAAIREHA